MNQDNIIERIQTLLTTYQSHLDTKCQKICGRLGPIYLIEIRTGDSILYYENNEAKLKGGNLKYFTLPEPDSDLQDILMLVTSNESEICASMEWEKKLENIPLEIEVKARSNIPVKLSEF